MPPSGIVVVAGVLALGAQTAPAQEQEIGVLFAQTANRGTMKPIKGPTPRFNLRLYGVNPQVDRPPPTQVLSGSASPFSLSRVSDAERTAIPEARAASAADAAPGKPSRAGRIAHVLGAVLVFVVLPMVLVGALVGQLGVGAMGTGLLLGAAGSKIGGTRPMTYLPPAIGVAGGLGAYTAYDWGWVALLATVGVIAGAGIRVGWLPALLMIPYAATFVTPVSTGETPRSTVRSSESRRGMASSSRVASVPPTSSTGIASRRRPPPWSRASLASPWAPAPRLAWPWAGPSPTGLRSRC